VLKPTLARVLRRVARLLGIPHIQQRLDSTESQILNIQKTVINDYKFSALERHLERRFQQQLADQAAHTQRLIADLHQLLNEAQAAMATSSQQHTETVTAEIRSHLEEEISRTKRDLDNIRRTTSNAVAQTHQGAATPPPSAIIDDALYISLEDHFRGDKAEVHKRQTEYVPYVAGIVSEQFPLIDLGCGRGEWLKVLHDNDIVARGIDSNVASVAECRESGLNADLGDLLETLMQLPDASCGAITMFQVLEHLPFDVVVNVFREIRRVLIRGGVFIGEIPNSETLRVGASTFWIDPTHQKPLFPAVLAFLANSVGFSGVTGKYSSPLAPVPDLTGLPDSAIKTILDLHHAINGPGDFALIATA
jgi:SAM-dependent methyltransferase